MKVLQDDKLEQKESIQQRLAQRKKRRLTRMQMLKIETNSDEGKENEQIQAKIAAPKTQKQKGRGFIPMINLEAENSAPKQAETTMPLPEDYKLSPSGKREEMNGLVGTSFNDMSAINNQTMPDTSMNTT